MERLAPLVSPQAARILGVSPLIDFGAGRRQPNRTHFASLTRSVSEGNKGKPLLPSPSLTLRVGNVSAIGLTPPGSPAQLSLRVYLERISKQARRASVGFIVIERSTGVVVNW